MTDSGKRLLDFLPPKINRDGEIIGALFANNNNSGALEKLFAYSETIRKNYSGTNNVYELSGDLIDQAMEIFSHFERFYNETDASFIKRNKSIFVRGGDVTFGTTWNVKHVFEYYFPKAKVFLLDNIGKWEDNILVNSSFESDIPSEIEKWTLSGCELNKSGAFSGGKGVYFTSNNGTVSQGGAAVEKDNTYFITCAVNGNVNIEVKGADNSPKHLFSIGEVISNEEGQTRAVGTDGWEFIQLFFNADKTENVTVTVKGTSGSKVDLITLDKKKNYPCFVVYAWFDGVTVGGNTLHLGETGEDPIPGINYDKESYFENTFFSGVSGNTFAADMYQDILDIVKTAGTKAEIVLLTKETD